MIKEGNLQDFKNYYSNLLSCCLREDAEELVDKSVELLGFVESVPDQANGAAVTRLRDNTYAVFEEWQDYTGHG